MTTMDGEEENSTVISSQSGSTAITGTTGVTGITGTTGVTDITGTTGVTGTVTETVTTEMSETTGGSSSLLRRSTRSRRTAESYYEDAAKAMKVREESRSSLGSTSRTTTSFSTRRQRSRTKEGHEEDDDDDENEDRSDHSDSSPESDEEDSDSDSDSDEDGDDEHEPPPASKKPVSSLKASARASAATSTLPKKSIITAPKPRRVQIQIRPTYKHKRPTPTTITSNTNTNNKQPNRSRIVNAMNALSKKVLYPEEITSIHSKNNNVNPPLIASLLLSHQRNKPDLHQIASNIVSLHNSDPNTAQCMLLNLLFRSIGGSPDTNLNPTEHNLEELDNDDWAHIITELVDQMRSTPLDKIVLCVNFNDAQNNSVGVQEFQKVFSSFWNVLAEVALQEGAMANSSPESNTNTNTNNVDESDPSDDNDDDLPISQSISKFQTSFLRLDVDLVQNLILRITELVSVGQPDVRAAATMASLHMAESVLSQSLRLHRKIATTQRYLNATQGAKKKESLSVQLQSLQRTHDNLMEVVLGSIMQGIFIHRYRDSNSTIRAVCMNSLSNMTLIRPDLLLHDQYLKYFGWLLSDKDAKVRIAAVSALLAPLERYKLQKRDANQVRNTMEIKLSSLEHLFAKFLGRMVDCVLDKSTEVQNLAMKLLLHLLREGFMDEVEDETLWNQVNVRAIARDTIPEVRKNALYFVMEQLEEFDDGGDDEEEDDLPINFRFKSKSKSKSGPKVPQRIARQRIDSLASWLAHSLSDGLVPLNQIQIKLADFIVTSLRAIPEHCSLITDWSALLEAITDDKVAILDGLTAGDRVDVAKQKVLVQMLSTAVMSEMGEENQKKDTKMHEKLSIILMTKLPDLMVNFKSDSSILANLTTLPSYLSPSIFSLSQRKKEFISLVENLSHVFLQSPDEIVLCNIARSICYLARGDHARANDVKNKLKEMFEELKRRILDLSSEEEDGEDNEDDDKETEESESPNKRKRPSKGKRVSKRRRISLASNDSSTKSSLSSQEDSEYVFMINLKRFRTLVKQCDALAFLGGDEGVDFLTSQIAKCLSKRLNVRKGDRSCFEDDSKVHTIVADAIDEGLSVLLTLTAWRLRLLQQEEKLLIEKEDLLVEEKEEEEDDEEMSEPHITLELRNRIIEIIELCFEQFLTHENTGEDASLEKYPAAMLQFTNRVQATAGKVSSDLRVLFPKAWKNAASPILRSLALTEDGRLIGGFVRHFRSQEEMLRMNEGLEKENKQVIRQLLLPLARSLATNWTFGNRREAGVALAHITGSGQDAASLVSTLSKLLKKMEPVRLLEAHMASLRQSYEDWMDNEPEDLESDRPTDAEMAAFEAAEMNHIEQFQALEQQAGRLSSSLGVGKLSDPKLAPALQGFLKEGIRFAFSTADDGQDDLVLGGRLTFLSIMSKYLNWIRRKKEYREEIRVDIIKREKELNEHPEFNEVHKDDLLMLTAFKTTLGLKVKETKAASPSKKLTVESVRDENSILDRESEDELGALSTPNTSQRRLSRGSSVGSSVGSIRSKVSSVRSDLSPLPEMERESSSPSSGLKTPGADTMTTKTTETPASTAQSIGTSRVSLQSSTTETPDPESQSTYLGKTQSIAGGGASISDEGTENQSEYTDFFSGAMK